MRSTVQRTLVVLLPLSLAAVAWQWHVLRDLRLREAALKAEQGQLLALREAVRETTGPATAGSGRASGGVPEDSGAPAAFDPGRWIAGVLALVDTQGEGAYAEALASTAALAADQVQAVLDEILDRPGRAELVVARFLLLRLAEEDPVACATYLAPERRGGPADGVLGQVLPVLVARWSAQDRPAAEAWFVSQQEAGTFAEATLKGGAIKAEVALFAAAAAGDIARVDPVDLARLDHGSRREFVDRVHPLLADNAARRALLGRVAGLADTAARASLLDLLGEKWAAALPFPEAVSLVDRLARDDPAREALASRIATGGQGAGLAERFDWFVAGSDDLERRNRVSAFVRGVAHDDFNAAGRWLREMETSPERDLAVEVFAASIAHLEPPSAVDWALEIGDAARRTRSLEGIYRRWSEDDEAGADAYFTEKGISFSGRALPGR